MDYATGWNKTDAEQMEEVEQRVRDEEPALLMGSPMCRANLARSSTGTSWSDASNTASFASECTRHSEMGKIVLA